MEYRRGDVRDPDALRDAFDGADVVVHLAFLVTGTAPAEVLRAIERHRHAERLPGRGRARRAPRVPSLCLLGGGLRLPPRQPDRDDRGVAGAARGPAVLRAGESRARAPAAGRGGPVRGARPVPAAPAHRAGPAPRWGPRARCQARSRRSAAAWPGASAASRCRCPCWCPRCPCSSCMKKTWDTRSCSASSPPRPARRLQHRRRRDPHGGRRGPRVRPAAAASSGRPGAVGRPGHGRAAPSCRPPRRGSRRPAIPPIVDATRARTELGWTCALHRARSTARYRARWPGRPAKPVITG